MANVMRIGGGSGAKPLLPSGYTRLAFIESTGTQYFDTEYKAVSENYRIKCSFKVINDNANAVLFGGGASTDIISVLVTAESQLKFYVGSGSVSNALSTFASGTDYEMECYANGGNFTVDLNGASRSGSYSGTINKDYPLFIFANNASGSASQFSSIRISKFQIYDNGTLVRDFIPCKNASGMVGLFDVVNGKFYGNAGTGDFVSGAVLGSGNNLVVEVDSGATVTATNGGKTVSTLSKDGFAVLSKLGAGTWNIVATKDGQTAEDVITISDDYPIDVAFGLPLSGLAVGSLVRVNENGSAVNYRVVHQGLPSSLYDSSCNGTWLLREAIHSSRAWDSSDNDYANSDIHSWLNSSFLGLFDSDTQDLIKQVKIPYVNGTGYGSLSSGANGLSTKVFLLSTYEVGWTTSSNSYGYNIVDGACLSYFSGTALKDSKRIGYLNGSATVWFLRVPRKNKTNEVLGVYTDGNMTSSTLGGRGVRPAMVLDGMVNPTPNADGSYTLMV